MLDLKDAVKIAKREIVNVFEEEGIYDVALEEVRFDDRTGVWRVTIGFARPFRNKGSLEKLVSSLDRRDFKVVVLDPDGRLAAVEERRLLEHG